MPDNTVPVLGLRGTGQFDTNTRPTNYREMYTFLEPNGDAPLTALLAMMSSDETNDPKYNNFRDEMPERVFTAAANAASGVTTLTMTSGDLLAYVVVGTVLVNASTGEVMRATANGSGTTLEVTRNIGGTTHAITSGQKLFVAGFAGSEASTSPTSITFDVTLDFNYTQIFKQAVELSGTLANTYLRTGSKEDEMITKALKLHMSDLERAFFFGRRAEVNGSTAQPTRYTGGLTQFVTNVIDVGTFSVANAMDETRFDQILIENIFAYGSKQKVAYVGPRVASLMQQIGKARWQPNTVNGGYGIQFTRYQTFAGDLMVYLHPMFRQIPGMEFEMFILDMPYIKYRYMAGRDTKLQQNIHGNDFDGKKHQFLSECGLEILQAKPHARVRGWQKLS